MSDAAKSSVENGETCLKLPDPKTLQWRWSPNRELWSEKGKAAIAHPNLTSCWNSGLKFVFFETRLRLFADKTPDEY
ncbi:MAG: hypothetical protein OHK0037_14410 [Elainellaceae cyanobacterium]